MVKHNKVPIPISLTYTDGTKDSIIIPKGNAIIYNNVVRHFEIADGTLYHLLPSNKTLRGLKEFLDETIVEYPNMTLRLLFRGGIAGLFTRVVLRDELEEVLAAIYDLIALKDASYYNHETGSIFIFGPINYYGEVS